MARARRAAALATVHSRSRGESWLRMVWTQAAGLPPPRLNTPVHDAGDDHDAVVATPDLLDEATGLAGEYDGSEHWSRARQHADAVRGELMAGVGLTVVRATVLDRASPALMARRLRDGHQLARSVGRRGWWVAPAQPPPHATAPAAVVTAAGAVRWSAGPGPRGARAQRA